MKELNLSGKDWFMEIEAAHYCGVSDRQFREHALAYGLKPRRFMGKKLYARADLFRAIDASPTWHGASEIPTRGYIGIEPSMGERLRPGRRRPFVPRRKPQDAT